MTANVNIAARIQDHRLGKNDLLDLRSPGLLAKWPMIGLFMFLFGGLAFGGFTYNLATQGPLLAWDKALATTLPAIGLKSPATLKPIMDAGYYLGSWGLIVLGFLFGLYFLYQTILAGTGDAGNWHEQEHRSSFGLSQVLSAVHGRRPRSGSSCTSRGFQAGMPWLPLFCLGFWLTCSQQKCDLSFGKGFVVAVALAHHRFCWL